eukprot:TRINITY_DN10983_c0_g1_i1.p1 TRINITY_DN10983_c0_g1~~TRINITY_DN10983_c0_g1_i1.p1  ORF type:complete len:137 (-),score=14.03 TRINITY_DN10983_c0_g1_i1:52-462(-)
MKKAACVLILVACVLAVNSLTCGGNCPSNDCRECPCGVKREIVNIEEICGRFSEWNHECCKCIVSHESSGDAHAANYNSNGSYDIGVFQINDIHWRSCSDGKAPCDVETNLKCAEMVWKEHRSFSPWSTCGGCGCC